VDINHEIDRLGAFFIIILGEFLYGIIYGSPAGIGLHQSILKVVWSLVIAFCLNWCYVNGDGSMDFAHPVGALPYYYCHLQKH